MPLDRVSQFLAARHGSTLIAAVKEKSELFDRYYPELFPHTIKPEEVYLAWQLGVSADKARQERLGVLVEQGDDDKTLTSLLGVAGTYWTLFCAHKLVHELNGQSLRLVLGAMNSDPFRGALQKYVLRALDEYIAFRSIHSMLMNTRAYDLHSDPPSSSRNSHRNSRTKSRL
jgi:hypothetical protein